MRHDRLQASQSLPPGPAAAQTGAGLALTSPLAKLALAAVPFVEPIFFGKTIDLLTQASTRGAEATLHDGIRIFSI
jgi:hypothetical protein